MASRSEAKALHRVGLTPTTIRLAWAYAAKGVGRHYIEHMYYDNVRVETLYDWKYVDGAGRAGLKVTFCKGSHRARYVELGVEAIGGGGDPLMAEITEGP